MPGEGITASLCLKSHPDPPTPCPAPSRSHWQKSPFSQPSHPTWLPTSHSRRISGKGNSLLNQMSSHRKQKQREPESWESRGGRCSAKSKLKINCNPGLIHSVPSSEAETLGSHPGYKNLHQSRPATHGQHGKASEVSQERSVPTGTFPTLPSRLQMK